jgi:hypothetical protein
MSDFPVKKIVDVTCLDCDLVMLFPFTSVIVKNSITINLTSHDELICPCCGNNSEFIIFRNVPYQEIISYFEEG